MTDEEIIANESYHTCGRCKYDTLSESMYPCNQCIHSQDTRKDLWVYKGNMREFLKIIDKHTSGGDTE